MSDDAEMIRWVRTNRRAAGSNWRDPKAPRTPGPWHISRTDLAGPTATFCGRQIEAQLNVQEAVLIAGVWPEGVKFCTECINRHETNTPHRIRARGRRHA